MAAKPRQRYAETIAVGKIYKGGMPVIHCLIMGLYRQRDAVHLIPKVRRRAAIQIGPGAASDSPLPIARPPTRPRLRVTTVTVRRLFSGFCQVDRRSAQGWHVCCNYFSEDPAERSTEKAQQPTPQKPKPKPNDRTATSTRRRKTRKTKKLNSTIPSPILPPLAQGRLFFGYPE